MQWEGNYARNLGPQLRDPDGGRAPASGPTSTPTTSPTRCAWPPSRDLPGHEVFYIASPDVASALTLPELVARHHGDAIALRELDRPDAGGISIAKARRLLGYEPDAILARPSRRHRGADVGQRRNRTPT